MLTRYAWAMTWVLGVTTLLFWPIRWIPAAVGLMVVAWLSRKRLGVAAPLLLLVLLSGVVFGSLFVVVETEAPAEPALTPNPEPASEYDLSVVSWLVLYDPLLAGLVLPVLGVIVPVLLILAVVYIRRTGTDRSS